MEQSQSFFDQTYYELAKHMFSEEQNAAQAEAIWDLLQLSPGGRVLDAPCGWGRLSTRLADKGAFVVGVDQSADLIALAEQERRNKFTASLQYLQHDLRTPLSQGDFDAACNIFTSFGYGSESDDLALFRTLYGALRPGGRLLVETNHRDLVCASLAKGRNLAMRLPDGTLLMDEPVFDPLAGTVTLNWHWSGPHGSGERHFVWRCLTPLEIVSLLESSGFRIERICSGLSSKRYDVDVADPITRLAIIAVRPR